MVVGLLASVLGVAGDPGAFRPLIEDTTLVQAKPSVNFGREQFVLGGEGRVALMRFPGVRYRSTPGMKVGSATLTLHLLRSDAVGTVSVKRVVRPWGEGRGRSFPTAFTKPTDPLTWGESSWSTAFAGDKGDKWALGGAAGDADARAIEGLSVEQSGSTLVIKGLKSTVQDWIDDPSRNFGLRITFANDTAAYSGDSDDSRPELGIEWADAAVAQGPDLAVVAIEPAETPAEGKATEWTATVANFGMAADGAKGTWTLPDGKTEDVTLSVPSMGSTKVTVKIAQKAVYGDPRRSELGLKVSASGDVNPTNDGLTVATMGLAVGLKGGDGSLAQMAKWSNAVSFVNDVVFPSARFGFAGEGVTERLRFVTDPAKADVTVDPSAGSKEDPSSDWVWRAIEYRAAKAVVRALVPISEAEEGTQLGWLADTRDDGIRVPALPMPDMFWYEPKQNEPPLISNGLLSRVEAGYLTAMIGKHGAERGWQAIERPDTVILQVNDTLGRPVQTGTVSLVGPAGDKTGEKKLTRTGLVVATLPKVDLAKPYVTVEVDRGNGEVDRTKLSVWSLYDWKFRGNQSAAGAEAWLMTTDVAVNPDVDLAQDKIVTDSQGRFPAELAVLIDGKEDQSVKIEPGNWVELDIGRDRAYGAVELVYDGAPFTAFEIYTFKTGQTPTDAQLFYRDTHPATTAAMFGQADGSTLKVTYKSPSVQSRYIRLLNTGTTTVSLKEIRVLGTK